MVNAVSFDAGNTLLYADPSPAEIYAEALSRLGRSVTPGEVAGVFQQAWAEMQRRTIPGRDCYSSVPGGERAWWGGFLREVLAALEHDAPWQTLLDDLYASFARPDMWRAFPEVRPTLQALSAKGLQLAVISNWDHRLPKILDDLDLARFFNVISVSSIEGVEKPSPEIFHRTAARLGVSLGAAAHVGDSLREDYHAASAVGMAPVLIDRERLFVDAEVRRIETLEALIDLVA